MKRIISAVCAVIMLITSVSLVQAQTAYEKDYDLIYDLGIIDENLSLTDKITYEQLAGAAIVISTGDPDSNYDALDRAKDMGLIKETAEGNVTLDNAVKILLRSAGYISSDEKTENGLFNILSGSKSIIKGVDIKDKNALTVYDVCGMVENLLNADTLVYDGKSYKQSGKSVIEDKFELSEINGIFFTGTAKKLASHNVVIDNKTYDTKKNFDEFQGKMVCAYVNKDGEVVSVGEGRYDNEEYIISANDIVDINSQSIEIYDEYGRVETLDIVTGATEIYNGEICTFKASDMNISNGFVRLIMTHGNTDYNVVIIEEYDIMVAGGVANGTVYDYHSNGASLELTNQKTQLSIKFNGENAQISDIKMYDVLYVMYSKDREKLFIEIVRNTVSGTIDAISDQYIKIGRRNYAISSYFKQYSKKPVIGENIELILDSAGFAVAIKKGINVNAQYAYFMGIYPDPDNFFSIFGFRLLTEDGTVKKMQGRKKVTVDGKTLNNNADLDGEFAKAFKKLVEVDIDGNKTEREVNDYVYQIVKYSTNAEGEITSIDTAVESDYEKSSEDCLTYDSYINGQEYRDKYGETIHFKAYPMQFQNRFGMSGEFTKVFYVPANDNVFDEYGNLDADKRQAATEKDYEVATPTILENDEKNAIVSAYNLTPGGIASACVIYNPDIGGDKKFTDDSAGLFILTKLTKDWDKESEEECYGLTGFLNGEEVKYLMEKDDYGRTENEGSNAKYVEPKEGDVMQIRADKNNRVVSYATRYRPSTNECFYDNGNDVWSTFGNYAGYVYDQDEYGIVTVSNLDTLANKRIIMKSVLNNVFIYDQKGETVTKATQNDVLSYVQSGYDASKIFIKGSYGVVGTMIIFINEEG